VLAALRQLDVAITHLANLVVSDTSARAFVAGLDSAHLRRAVEDLLVEPIIIEDPDVADLRSTLVAGVLGQLRDGVRGTADHASIMAESPGALRDFTPICEHEDVAQHIDSLLLKRAQRELQREQMLQPNPDDDTPAAAADNVLRPAADAILAAVRRSAEQRCKEPDIARLCHAVVDAANADFRPVYESVWARIRSNEVAGAIEYKATAEALSFPAAGAVQTAADAVQLLQHAANVKPEYDKVVGALVEALADVELIIPPVRAWGASPSPLVVGSTFPRLRRSLLLPAWWVCFSPSPSSPPPAPSCRPAAGRAYALLTEARAAATTPART
jgi:hypothetical protein